MTATRTRRLAPLLIATLLAGGAASLSSTAFAAPTTTTANVTTDTDTETDSPRPVKHIAKTPRTVKSIPKTPRTSGGVGGEQAPTTGGSIVGTGGDEGVPISEWYSVMWSADREMNKVHNEL
ncbi:hypothetical protein ACFYYS_18665 [Streptomyces sp. NPDC002120]|uniref:hypothetical protein n=1 Tax=Streptomyces sp. NPDC002120 TaxID=3364631 RepID=UPI0036898FD7